MTIFVCAGEASGDAYGAALINEIRRLAPEAPIRFIAIGGPKLRATADQLVSDSSQWGAISVIQSFKVGPRVLAGMLRAPEVLDVVDQSPQLLIPIDFGFVNSRLARMAKARDGWKVLAFVPPGSWRRNRQAKWGPELFDGVSTPFSWSADILTQMGTPNVHWFGHPLKQLLKDRLGAANLIPRLNQVAVLPGSRTHELQMNLPLVAASLPDLPAEFALSPQVDEAKFAARWKKLAPNRDDKITVGDSAGVLLRSRAALVCSGTATLEAAMCRCPMAVIYAVSRLMYAEAKVLRFKRPKFVALPNILLDRMFVDEFIAHDAFPEKVRPCIHALLEDGERRQRQLDGFEELDGVLGPDDAITQTANLALQLLSRNSDAAVLDSDCRLP